ncbi:hypothetical protein BDV39DRAFT_79057 [Aspergillus sergii]|uniref:Uncharacterized protein n=1 Tax=Aspergillus sergii TaxID=1034303 RepID=A0A5N6X307_9EURO|nr:hypothetical protein BDV39DRAFT_79057 [Aspergillus sergii]
MTHSVLVFPRPYDSLRTTRCRRLVDLITLVQIPRYFSCNYFTRIIRRCFESSYPAWNAYLGTHYAILLPTRPKSPFPYVYCRCQRLCNQSKSSMPADYTQVHGFISKTSILKASGTRKDG